MQSNQTTVIKPDTVNFSGGNRQFGYTAILSDSDVAEIRATQTVGGDGASASVPQFIGDSEAAQSVTIQGMEFEVIAKEQFDSNKTATIIIIGNETGGRVSIDLTVKKLSVSTIKNRGNRTRTR